MPMYKLDEQDVLFNLFEYVKIQDLTAFDRYKEQGQDVYKSVMSEGIKFAMNELDPLNKAGDEEGCQFEAGEVKAPKGFKEAYQKMGENGFIAVDINPDFGGFGLPVSLNTALYEVFCGANTSFLLYSGLSRGSAHLIETFGSDKLKNLFCQKMYGGSWGGTMCLTEPQAGSAVGDLSSKASKNSDGTYNIKGNKIFITSGQHDLTENIIHLLLARVDGDPEGTKGISLFVVPKIWVNDDGSLGDVNDVQCVNIEHKLGINASPTCALNFGEAGKCRGYLVGEQGQGMKYMFQMMNDARLLCGVQGQASAATSYENALVYAKDRTQFGATPIINYPDVRKNLSYCKTLVEGMRGLLYKTGRYLDEAHYHPDAAVREHSQNRADLLTPICKAYCSDQGFRVCETALQVYGGYGYCKEYPAEQYLRDVKIASIYEGTNGIQSLDLMGRKLAMKQGQLFREFYEDLSAFVSTQENHSVLKDQIASFKKAVDTVAQVAMKIAEWGMSGEQTKPMLSATDFLEMCGHVCAAHVLLEHAVIAHEKINSGEASDFYKNKIHSAKFFTAKILPGVQMKAKAILSEDTSAMEMAF